MGDPTTTGLISISENIIYWTLPPYTSNLELWSPEFHFKNKAWQLYANILTEIFGSVNAIVHLCNFGDSKPSFSVEIGFETEYGTYTINNTAKWDDNQRYKLCERIPCYGFPSLFSGTKIFQIFCKIEERTSTPALEKNLSLKETDNAEVSSQNNIRRLEDSAAENVLSSCSEYKNMILSGQTCDVTINITGKKIQVHRAVLRDNSSFFSKIFNKSKDNIVFIEECDVEIFQYLLFFMYSGKIKCLPSKSFPRLYYASDKYGLPKLKQLCVDSMKSSLTEDTVFEIIHLAKVHNETCLLEHSTNFFARNAEAVLATVEWHYFLKKNTLYANQMLIDILRQRPYEVKMSDTSNFREDIYKRLVAMTLDSKNQ